MNRRFLEGLEKDDILFFSGEFPGKERWLRLSAETMVTRKFQESMARRLFPIHLHVLALGTE